MDAEGPGGVGCRDAELPHIFFCHILRGTLRHFIHNGPAGKVFIQREGIKTGGGVTQNIGIIRGFPGVRRPFHAAGGGDGLPVGVIGRVGIILAVAAGIGVVIGHAAAAIAPQGGAPGAGGDGVLTVIGGIFSLPEDQRRLGGDPGTGRLGRNTAAET